MAIAGIAEEALKLMPIAVLAGLAPRRAARFATVDWVLLGVASGSAFLAVEETLRRVAWQTGVGRGWFDFGPDDEVPEGWIAFRLFPVPSDWDEGVAGFGGHAVMTPIITGLVGLGIAWWRATRNPGWRLLAVVLPVVALWSAIADHAGYNVQNALGAFGGGLSSLLSGDPEAVWLDPDATSVPWWLRAPWSWLGHGHGRAGIFLVIVAVCLLVDARRLASLPSSGLLVRRQPPRWPSKTIEQVTAWTQRWPLPFATAAQSVTSAVAALVWVVLRDLGDAVMAFSRQRGEPRRQAAARGMSAVAGQRAARELAFETLAGPVNARRRRLLALAAVVLLGWLAFLLAPQTAAAIGVSASDWPAWLAGVADILAEWWAEQPLAVQLAIGAGIAGLVVLSGGSLGVALGVSGALTWGLDKGHGIATFVRDPHQATRDYITTATPGQVAADTLGVALTFAPGNFVGARVGQGVRAAAEDIAADPGAWLAARRTMLRDEPERGSVSLEWFLARKPVPLADGAPRPALTAAEEAAAAARYEAYPSTPVKGASGPARDGQIAVYGDNERIVDVPGQGIKVHPDGFTPQYGAVGDYKHVMAESSFYNPETLSSPGLREVATQKMDKTLRRLQLAADEVMGGDGVVEITTNSTDAARFIEGRMNQLGIRGYVRLTR